jgi:hypothetical protein
MREPCLPIELRCRAPQQDGRLRAKFANLTNVIESVFACAQLPRERETARVSLHPNYLAGAAAFIPHSPGDAPIFREQATVFV